jgi:uncharacterized protein
MVLKGVLNNKPVTFQFLVLVMLWFMSFSLMNVLVAGGLLLQHGLENYEALANNLTSGNIDNNTLKAMQIAVSVGMFFLPAFLFAYLKGEKAFSFLKLSFKPSLQLLLWVVPIVLLAAPFIAAMLELNQQMSLPAALSQLEQYLKTTEQANEQMLKKLLVMNTPVDFLINMLMVAVIPALGEEIFFRGCLQRVLTDLYRNAHIAIIMGAIIFSFIHFQFYGFLPRMILGILFGYMLLWTGNLWYSVLAHFLHNGLQVTLLYLFQQKIIDIDIEATQSVSPVLAFGATALLFYVLAMFQKKSGSIV